MSSGGLTTTKPATAETQLLCDAVKVATEETTNKRYCLFEAISFRSQVVEGTLYFVKVKVGSETHDYLELRIFVSLFEVLPPFPPVLQGVLQRQTAGSPIIYFDKPMPSMGGLGDRKPADAEIQKLCDKVKGAVEVRTLREYKIFEAIAFRSQVVAGINYFVLVKGGDGKFDYLVLRIYVSLDEKVSLSGVMQNLTADAPIIYFEPPRRPMFGGLSDPKPADENVKKLCAAVKSDAEKKTGKKYDIFEAIAYRTQVVAGLMYFVKVKAGCGEFDYLELAISTPPLLKILPPPPAQMLEGELVNQTEYSPIIDFLN